MATTRAPAAIKRICLPSLRHTMRPLWVSVLCEIPVSVNIGASSGTEQAGRG